jgi:hypothetical protein
MSKFIVLPESERLIDLSRVITCGPNNVAKDEFGMKYELGSHWSPNNISLYITRKDFKRF